MNSQEDFEKICQVCEEWKMSLMSLIFPNKCRVCNKIISSKNFVCGPCQLAIKKVEEPLCVRCGLPFESGVSHPCVQCLDDAPYFDWHRSVVYYEEPVRSLLHQFKYGQLFEMMPMFAQWMSELIHSYQLQPDFIVPVPLAIKRLKERTFNQSLEIAKDVSKLTKIPVLIHSLKKIRDTLPQTRLKREERLQNLKGAFEWDESVTSIEGKKILLIDDVMTTGSTLSTCAEVLRYQKTSWIGAMTVAFNVIRV